MEATQGEPGAGPHAPTGPLPQGSGMLGWAFNTLSNKVFIILFTLSFECSYFIYL